MARLPWALAAAATAILGCGDDGVSGPDDGSLVDRPIDSPDDQPIDAPPIDGPVDAPTDAAGCGNDVRLAAEYVDWDSTLGNPMGIGGATWSVVGDPLRHATTSPGGSVSLCLDPSHPSQIAIDSAGGYVPALLVADPAVLSGPGSHFIMRGVKSAGAGNATSQFMEFGVQYNGAFAHLLVLNLGPSIPLALAPVINPPQRSFVNGAGFNDITWTESDTGKLTLFPNRPVNVATATLTSTAVFTGPSTIPLASGRFTIVVIR